MAHHSKWTNTTPRDGRDDTAVRSSVMGTLSEIKMADIEQKIEVAN